MRAASLAAQAAVASLAAQASAASLAAQAAAAFGAEHASVAWVAAATALALAACGHSWKALKSSRVDTTTTARSPVEAQSLEACSEAVQLWAGLAHALAA